MRKLFRGKALAVAAVVGGAVLASVAPVLAEVSVDSPSAAAVRLESPAKFRAWGAAIDVEVSYACPVNDTAMVSLNVSQAVLGGVALGYKHEQLPCTGAFETATFTVQPHNGRSFRLGTAFGQVSLTSGPSGTHHHEREFKIGL